MSEFNPNCPPKPLPDRPAICWTTDKGNGMSTIHIGDCQKQATLCGKSRKGTFGPSWLWLGDPVAPDTLTTLGDHNASVTCVRCWELYCDEEAAYKAARAAFDKARAEFGKEG